MAVSGRVAYMRFTMMRAPHVSRLARSVSRGGAIAAAVLLVGCQVGPPYAKPEADIPASYRAADAALPAATAIAPDWWAGFHSPTLNALMADAATNSFDVRAAVARIGQADAQLRAAGAALLPEVDGSAKASWTRSTASTVGIANGPNGLNLTTGQRATEQRIYSLGPNVSYELDFWGAIRSGQQAAAANALFSCYDRQTVALTTLGATATTWFTALAYQDRLAVARNNLKDSEDILAAIRARLDVGTASLLDVAQEEALVAGIRATIPNLRNLRDQEVVALAILVGRLPEAVPLPSGTLTSLELPAVSPGLPSTLLARRPDVASAEAQLIEQNANIRVARAAFFPTITLTGSAGWQSTALQSLLNGQSLLFSAAANAAQTIFDNGKLAAQYDQAKARYDELLADYQKAVVQAFTDVETALIEWRETTEQEKLEEDAVRTAQRAADIARAQVEAGTLDIVTALQTQSTLYGDQDTLAQVRLARVLALVNLYKALGGGWSATDVMPPAAPIFNGVL
jgi:NodT family efflux transporter outer membrane factor (OMF) lipoprotein